MFALFFGIILVIAAVAVRAIPVDVSLKRLRSVGSSALGVIGILIGLGGSVGYNDAGYCQHIRTIFGSETSVCNTGWYFEGWGTSTQWPHYITVANTIDSTADGHSIMKELLELLASKAEC